MRENVFGWFEKLPGASYGALELGLLLDDDDGISEEPYGYLSGYS